MVERTNADKRERCPECGGTEFQLQTMGATLYVVCDSGCQDRIIGKVVNTEKWCDGL